MASPKFPGCSSRVARLRLPGGFTDPGGGGSNLDAREQVPRGDQSGDAGWGSWRENVNHSRSRGVLTCSRAVRYPKSIPILAGMVAGGALGIKGVDAPPDVEPVGPLPVPCVARS